ncbi:MAG: hypothetical protein IPM88_10180 [Nitrospira sp.]|nr:hypothetical protein [Nitrospira sp.]
MYILGLATMGESAAALMKDGVLVAAVEEERFTRVKHEGCFPLRAITSCLNRAGISLAEVAHIGVYWQPLRMGVRTKAVLKTALTHPTAFLGKMGRALAGNSRLRAADKQWQVRAAGPNCFWFAPSSENTSGPSRPVFITWIIIAAIWPAPSSPRRSKRRRSWSSMVQGKMCPRLWLSAPETDLRVLRFSSIPWPHSLGHFYSAMTGFLDSPC